MTYESDRRCAQCGFPSPRTEVCGECEMHDKGYTRGAAASAAEVASLREQLAESERRRGDALTENTRVLEEARAIGRDDHAEMRKVLDRAEAAEREVAKLRNVLVQWKRSRDVGHALRAGESTARWVHEHVKFERRAAEALGVDGPTPEADAEYRDELAIVRAEMARLSLQRLEAAAAIAESQQRVATLRKALEWYGDASHYVDQRSPTGLTTLVAVAELDAGRRAREALAATADAAPVPMVLACPQCGVQHIDEGEWAATRHHKTHQCQACKHEWRPFPYATVGVAAGAPSDVTAALGDGGEDAPEMPYVCPGCHVVGDEKCLPGCIDDEMAREREDEQLYGDGPEGEDDDG